MLHFMCLQSQNSTLVSTLKIHTHQISKYINFVFTESIDKISTSTSFSIYFLIILGIVYLFSLLFRFINGKDSLYFSNLNDFLILPLKANYFKFSFFDNVKFFRYTFVFLKNSLTIIVNFFF